MKKRVKRVAVGVISLFCACCLMMRGVTGQDLLDEQEQAIQSAVTRVAPSVVRIEAIGGLDLGATFQVTRLLRWTRADGVTELASDLGPGATIDPAGMPGIEKVVTTTVRTTVASGAGASTSPGTSRSTSTTTRWVTARGSSSRRSSSNCPISFSGRNFFLSMA